MNQPSKTTLFAETSSDDRAIENAKEYIKRMNLSFDNVKIVRNSAEDMIRVVVR